MRHPRAGCAALCLSLVAGVQASPILATRQSDCATLSTTTPNWQLSNAVSSDWPGGGGGRVQMFALHVPTGELQSCVVNYSLDAADGHIIDFDPTSVHNCTNFGNVGADVKSAVTLNMDTLLLNIKSTWTCAEDDAVTYEAAGETSLQRDTSPGACLVEPSQIGESTTCPIADVEVEGVLAE